MNEQMTHNELLEEKLHEFRGTFFQELKATRERLITCIDSIASSKMIDTEADKALSVLSHRLSGSAGAFGFEEVGDAAFGLEALVRSKEPDPDAIVSSCTNLVDVIDKTLPVAAVSQGQCRVSPAQNKPVRITYVEDEADIREIAEIALSSIGGYEVDVCVDGYEALSRMPEFMPDLIILDVMMPGIGGVETFKCLRENPKLREVPVIFMTARVQDEEVETYRAIGCTDVIAKPFDPMELPQQIEKIWRHANGLPPKHTEACHEQTS